MFGRSTASYDRLLEKATSHLLLEPDWDSILSICDCIRQGDVQPKYVLGSLKKKINSENPHVAMFALQVTESVVKNCGSSVHAELATKEFMEFLKDVIKVRGDPVKTKVLELIQTWSHAFRNEASYKAVIDTFHLLKMEGHTFPALKEADAMFLSEKAPDWKDGDCCHRCRVQFTVVQRKHHCRNCGQVFCNKCSSKNSIIPRFGIEREVRVCETCFDALNKFAGAKKGSEEELPPEYLNSPLAQQSQAPPSRSEAELQEEEELQLAIALSKSEAESKGKERDRLRSGYTLYGSSISSSETKADTEPVYAQPSKVLAPMIDTSEMDPELARYLNRNYWEQKIEDNKSAMQPSAPVVVNEAKNTNGEKFSGTKVNENYQNGEVNEDETQFLNALSSSIEIFCNRMRSNQQRGRSITNDSSVQTLFMTINAMHPQLMKHMQQQEESRAHFEGLQDKLAQLKDAREALNSLREEHREKRRQEMEELERQRQIQMAQKLAVMRQQKQEYLEFQRQRALQRMQEQELEMAMRREREKQMQQLRIMQQYGYSQPQVPGMYAPTGPTFSPGGGSLEGSPLHHPHPQPLQQQPYYAPDGTPVPPPLQPMATSGAPAHGGPIGGPPVMTTGAGGPPNQPMYNAAGAAGGGAGAAGGGGFPPGGQPPTTYQPTTTQYQPADPQYQPQGAPPIPPQGYAPPGGMEYNQGPFNMHGVAASLPGQGMPQMPMGAPQPYMPPPGAQYHPQPQGGAMPPGAPPTGQPLPQQQPQPQQPPPPPQQQPQQPQQQQPPAPPHQAEPQLISFD